MSKSSKKLSNIIKEQIGECPTYTPYRKIENIEYLEFDGSIEQLQNCIDRLKSGKYKSFNISSSEDDSDHTFIFISQETEEEFEIRYSREKEAVKKWQENKDKITDEFNKKQKEERDKRGVLYKDPKYIEYLRLKNLFENKEN